MREREKETICAVSTAPGVGGIAVVRISGDEAFSICDAIFCPQASGVSVVSMKANTVRFGRIMNGTDVLDEVLLTVFRAPHSFTGEDSVEISCHGSLYIQQEILKLLLANGCRMATAGEFTQRAFMSGKMDLSQAEAVADLIASQSRASHRLAMSQMRGGFSNELMSLRLKLLDFTSLVELELDFADHEELEFADRSQLKTLADEIETKIAKLAHSFSVGNVIKNGIPVAIVGETNAGKSTLLNALVGEERAIVSDIHGTTRDVIEDAVNINGYLFRFIDTAGLRQTDDAIENMGIERTYQMIEKASIVLWTIDCTKVTEHIEWLADRVVKRSKDKKLLLVLNKVDCISAEERITLDNLFEPYKAQRIYISAKNGEQVDVLKELLYQCAQLPQMNESDVMVTNIRHYEALSNALTSIHRVQEGLKQNISGDFLSQDLRECLHFLGEITGEITTDEVLGNIFAKFCVGK